jgi:hypothetical protein
LVPVTDDPVVMFELLGFERPADILVAVKQAALDRTACSVLCASSLFDPSMVSNTADHNIKFGGGRSALFEYAQATWGGRVRSFRHDDEEADEEADCVRKRLAVHAAVEQRFPEVRAARAEFRKHERMIGRLQETLWGPSILHMPPDPPDDLIHLFAQRWKPFLKLRGLRPLFDADPAEALADWLRFRGDDASPGAHDWSFSNRLLPTYEPLKSKVMVPRD